MSRTTIVIGSLGTGGTERVAVRLANHWAAKGMTMTLITLADDEGQFSLDERIEVKRLGVAGCTDSRLSAIRGNRDRILALRRAIKASKPDQIIAMLTETNIVTLLACIGLGVRVVVSERSNPAIYPYRKPWRLLRILVYRLADHIVVQTKESANWFSSFDPVVIPNPAPASSSLLPRDGREQLMVGLGRLGPEKGYAHLITAFAHAYKRYPQWRLEIHGEGVERETLQRQIDRLGRAGEITLPGINDDTEKLFKRTGIFVLTSDFEGFPNALCEAMTYGAAVISFDCDYGPRDLIENEKTGLLVPPGDDALLATAMERLMGDADLRSRLGRAATEVEERFSMEKVAGEWEALWI